MSAVDETDQRSMSLFEKEDVKETSYRVTTGKIDIHLCDDTPIQKSVLGDGGQLGGSMQIVVNWLSLEHYPYHLALTPRTHWSSHNLASIKRAEWESELMSSYDKNSREEKIRRQKSHVKVRFCYNLCGNNMFTSCNVVNVNIMESFCGFQVLTPVIS